MTECRRTAGWPAGLVKDAGAAGDPLRVRPAADAAAAGRRLEIRQILYQPDKAPGQANRQVVNLTCQNHLLLPPQQ